MTLKDLAKTALSNLGRHRVRTVLSAIGVTVGILTLVTMLSLGVGVQREITRVFRGTGLETVRIRPVTEEQTVFTQFSEPERKVLITPDLVEQIRARDDVVEVQPHMYLPRGVDISLKVGEQMMQVSVSEPSWISGEPFTAVPELIAGEELDAGAGGQIVISADPLVELGYEDQAAIDGLIGQEVALVLKAPRGDSQVFPLRIVGVFEPNYGFDGPYFDAHIGVADSLAMKAWWYNSPDLLDQARDEGRGRAVDPDRCNPGNIDQHLHAVDDRRAVADVLAVAAAETEPRGTVRSLGQQPTEGTGLGERWDGLARHQIGF